MLSRLGDGGSSLHARTVRRLNFFILSKVLVAFWASLIACFAHSQQNPIPVHITQVISEANLAILKGNTHPLARPEFDRGSAPSNLPLNRMLLVLQRSPQQERELKSLLDHQQQRSSVNYHAWVTPEQFGQKFGPADRDIQIVTSWLVSHGFQVNGVGKGRTTIEFSGTAGQVKEAFHAEIHRYEVNGKVQWANSTDPEIPAALTSVVAGIATLHNFPRRPLYHLAGRSSSRGSTVLGPPSGRGSLYTGNPVCGITGNIPCYGVGPYDFATIYNVLPLWNAPSPIDGTGQTIAIVGQSDIYSQDFSDFRADFGLPPGTLKIVYNGTRPVRLATEGDELESDIDIEWSGSVAKGATIELVVSASTLTTSGVDLSALYIVDNNLAPVMSESYGACEFEMGVAGNQFYNQLWQQAAAQGITAFVAAGDSGSAVCDRDSLIATQGLSVSGISSTPYDVAVGGTDFDDLSDPSTYWNLTNDPVTLLSAKSYIPEMTWNDTCTNSEFLQFTGATDAESDCNDSSSIYSPNFLIPVGGSGGASSCTAPTGQSVSTCAGGYTKPSWQTGIGVPNDGKRDVPDVSLFAADGLNGSFYVACETDLYSGCANDVHNLALVGGTSVAAPAFAGIMAMIVQKTQSRQGAANYVFYPLAAQPGASCNSTGAVGSSCIFYDITTGTIAMPCTTGTPDCVTNTSGDQNGVLSGYATTTGYDLATGLGSVNAANLVNNWSSVSFQPTVTTLSLNPTNQITHGSTVNLNLTVAPETGTGTTPTGLVSIQTSKGKAAGNFTLTNGAVSATTGLLPGGSYTVTAHYAGDGTYAASDSSPAISVTVSPEPSTTTLQALAVNQSGNIVPFTTGPYGSNVVFLQANVSGQSGQGVPTGTVNITQTENGTTTNLTGDPFSLNSEGYVVTPLPGYYYLALPPGTYSYAANYSGDASFKANSSPSVSYTITQAQTTVATTITNCNSSPCVYTSGGMLQMFAWISTNPSQFPNNGTTFNQATGTVTFYSNGIQLGTPVPVDSSESPPFASIVITQLPLGTDTITEQYSGDTNYAGSTSAGTIVDTISGSSSPTFTMTANPTVVNISSPGQSGSTTLTFTEQNGLIGSTTLSPSLCSNLPPKTTCSFSPAVVAFTSSATSIPVTLTITTTGQVSATSSSGLKSGPWTWFSASAAICVAGICLFPLGTRQRRRWRPMFALVILAGIACSVGGSGTSGGSGTGGGGSSGTPAGNYVGVTVTVTINGVIQSVNNLSVNVQ
jgi:hypothetical protein